MMATEVKNRKPATPPGVTVAKAAQAGDSPIRRVTCQTCGMENVELDTMDGRLVAWEPSGRRHPCRRV